MITNKFAVFTTVEDMFACGVYANKDKTQLYDSDHEIHSQTLDERYQESGNEIPYDTVCFIKRNNCTFVGGRCMGTPLRTVHLKDLVASTKTTSTTITVEGVTFNCSTDITLDAGDYIIYNTGDDDGVERCVVKYNTKTSAWDIKAVYQGSGFLGPIKYSCTQETTIRIIDGDNAGATTFDIYKTSSVKSAKRIERDKALAELCKKPIVHRAVPMNAQIGSIYYFAKNMYSYVVGQGQNEYISDHINEESCDENFVYCIITPDVIRYDLYKNRKPFDNSCDEYIFALSGYDSYFSDLTQINIEKETRSPYFIIGNASIRCVKPLDYKTAFNIADEIMYSKSYHSFGSDISIKYLRYRSRLSNNPGQLCNYDPHDTIDYAPRVTWAKYNGRCKGRVKIAAITSKGYIGSCYIFKHSKRNQMKNII